MLNALSEIWVNMNTRRRAFLVGGVAALAVVLVILTRLVTAPSYALLYSGLDPAAAGEVMAAIEAQSVPYRIQGDAIFVEQSQRDSLRMNLAGQGLPANGGAGYELLDSLSGFGTTSQMFDAAYWRAKEGELARTILSSPRIRAARVHIANPGADPFQPTQEVTASVAIRPAAGGLGPGHAQALRYLVASSIPGLLPENVTVIDADSGQILGGADRMSATNDAMGRAEELRRNIERLLAARVGPGNAVVQVSVELNTSRETIVERRIDPESRVIISTDTEERDNSSNDGGGGGVTVASNLPEGDAAESGEGSASQTSESRERVTFDMSELQREVERGPGDIRRISVAVLLNGVSEIGADGIANRVPRPVEEVEALEMLVRSAIGFDAERGDAVTIESMAFDETVAADLAQTSFSDRMSFDLSRIIQTVVLAAAALFIAFGLLRPMLRRDVIEADLETNAADPRPLGTLADLQERREIAALRAPDAAEPQTEFPPDTTVADTGGAPADLPTPAISQQEDFPLDPVERLRRLIEEREEETVEILRSWMEEDEEVRP